MYRLATPVTESPFFFRSGCSRETRAHQGFDFAPVNEGRDDPQIAVVQIGCQPLLGWHGSVATKNQKNAKIEVNCRCYRIQVSDWGWAPVWDLLSGSGRFARLDSRSLCCSLGGRTR